jgi:hypothetical protein
MRAAAAGGNGSWGTKADTFDDSISHANGGGEEKSSLFVAPERGTSDAANPLLN